MKYTNHISCRLLFLFFVFTFWSPSFLCAQEITIITPPTVGYDTTVNMLVRFENMPAQTDPIEIRTASYSADLRVNSVTRLDDSTLTINIYTGTACDTGLIYLLVYYNKTIYYTSNGFLLLGTRLHMYNGHPVRGYSKRHQFFAEPHLTPYFNEDSILSIICYDNQGNITPHITFDSIRFDSSNKNIFSALITTTVDTDTGFYKIVIVTRKNGVLTYKFKMPFPNFNPIGNIRGASLNAIACRDLSYNVLFIKGAPNIVNVYRNGILRSDIIIDSTKAVREDEIILYGKVSDNAEVGDYDLVVQNQFDTVRILFSVYKPKILSITTKISGRKVNRGDSSMCSINMQYGNLTKGITTFALLNPQDSVFIGISNISVTNNNTCKFLLQVDPLAKLGVYYIILTNSFDTLTIIDSLYITKGTISKNISSINSESRAVVELQGNKTLFTQSPVSLRATASDNGTITVDSFKVINNTRITVWLTADALAEGTGRIQFYSPLDDSINVSSSLTIKRPVASIPNKKITMGLNDIATTTINGNLTHFKRIKQVRFSYKDANLETVYDTGRIKAVNYTASNDSLLSLTIGTDANDLPTGLLTIVLVDSLSGELVISNSILLVTPALGNNFRKKIKKQTSDTLWVPLTYFSESQMAHIDSVTVGNSSDTLKSFFATGYSYKSVGNQKGILINVQMNKPIKSTDWCSVRIAWDYTGSELSQSSFFEIMKPAFVSKSTPDLTFNANHHCRIVFDGLFEDSVAIISLFNGVKITNTIIKGDTIEFDAKLIRENDLYYYITSPNENYIYESEFKTDPAVGLKEIADATSFNIYPVPAGNSIFIRSADNSTIQSIVIYDMLGKSFTYKGNNKAEQQLEISGLRSGAYSIFINTSAGTVVKRFMKE